MSTLPTDLRNKLERVVVEARDAAEAGARAALEAMAVHHYEPYPHMNPGQRKLRNHLRARARQLGDPQDRSGRLAIDHLVGECAYEHWHRMLFARFLAENGLLIEPEMRVAISLAEAQELAKEEGVDVWAFASRCAQRMLPQIFRTDDPLLQVSFATEHRIKLERLLASLPAAVFTASDALGWVYQFWQSKKKDEVNRSEVKIGADELPAVTQLFTEPYMVEFLLHNTLGAWWAGKRMRNAECGTRNTEWETCQTEEECRRLVALPGVQWEYLRFVRGDGDASGQSKIENRKSKIPWRPAAGTFDGWPKPAAELRVLDPCCGSGHFLVAALRHLAPIRMAEEGLSAREAVDAVLRDNLHGLEIDERCCQIAAFALAFAAWTYPDADGYRPLPDLHIACTGIGPESTEEQWLKLAEESGVPIPRLGREAIKNGLLNLHQLFSQAPTLGSLINPAELSSDMFVADYETIQPYLTAIMSAEKADDETRERAIAAAGMVKAADLLASEYTLVITNVPYLGRSKQDDLLKAHLETHCKEGRADLATAFVLRCLELCDSGGRAAMVTPQNWLFLTSYRKLRETLLKRREWNFVARLGPGAFETISGHVVNVALLALSATTPGEDHTMAGIDVSAPRGQTSIRAAEKAALLRGDQPTEIALVRQAEQLRNPNAAVVTEHLNLPSTSLGDYTDCYHGLTTTDFPRFARCFWELPEQKSGWIGQQSTVDQSIDFGGRSGLLWWEADGAEVRALRDAGAPVVITGLEAWKRDGVVVSQMSSLCTTLYSGDAFDTNVAVIVPRDGSHLPAVWAFASAPDFAATVRRFNTKVVVEYVYYPKLPFDLAHWQKVAAEKYPNGLPEPESDDPRQWLFHGRPEESTAPLQVAVARLLGYRWPAELDDKMRLSKRARALVKRCDELLELADDDGIVCIPSVRGEEPGADRLLAMLDASDLEPEDDLEDWLRNDFFQKHCELFHHRPFVWHIWDGRKRDGFGALVNYHKLAEGKGKGRKLLESLTYSYLGEWITRQKDGVKRGEGGAEDRLAAALELQKRLEAILEGEPPFDLFIRWKPLHEQPIGWEPDINDGVRLNIRPFLASDLPKEVCPGARKGAGILRWKANIKWAKDRGKEPERPKVEHPWFWGWDEKTEDFMGTGKEPDGNRWNDCHYTNKAKQQASDETKKGDK